MLAGDFGHLFDADLGDDGTGGIKMGIAHNRYICDYRDFKSSDFCELRDRKICGNREDAGMSDPQQDIRLWMQEELSKRPHGTKGRLAKFLNVRADAVTRMMNTDPAKETREIKAHELELLRQFFSDTETGTSQADASAFVPIRGLVGANPDGTIQYAVGDSNFGEVAAPIDSESTTEALEVRGDSMFGTVNDGWIVFYEDKETPNEKHMGELCVCWLEDGRVLLKFPSPGSVPGTFNLESANARMMRDVAVSAFSLVTDIKTRQAAKRFIRRNPDHHVEDLKIA